MNIRFYRQKHYGQSYFTWLLLYQVSWLCRKEKLRKAEPFSVTSERTGDTLDKIHFLRCIFTTAQFTGDALKNPLIYIKRQGREHWK